MSTKGFKLLILLAVIQSSLGQDFLFKFASSKHYRNYKLVHESSKAVIATRIHPISRSTTASRLSCFKECFVMHTCQAINFYSSKTHHTCELLADNFCLTHGRLALMHWPGATIWDKVESGSSLSCIEQHFQFLPQNHWCETIRPGCIGTWPNCNDCVQSCFDCEKRSKTFDGFNCTLWPGSSSTHPIFTSCVGNATVIMSRNFDPKRDSAPTDYVMSFADMNRLTELGVYNYLLFTFSTESTSETFVEFVSHPYIHVNGTLGKSFPPSQDGKGIDFSGMEPNRPFVLVERNRDIEACGSFWLLEPTNTLYCPGGSIGLFGTVRRDSLGNVVNTGIRYASGGTEMLTSGVVVLDNINLDHIGRSL